MSESEALGVRLRRLRTEKKLSLNELSEYTGVSFGAIVAIEHGKTKNPTVRVMILLAQFFGLSVEELYWGKE